MNQNPLSDDPLDGLLSDFFKAQMKKPWPAAPAAYNHPQPQPAVASHDHGSRARYTLAASVALLLGTCWTLSNGFQPGETQTGPGNRPAAGPTDLVAPSTAFKPAALEKLRQDNAEKGNNPVAVPPKIDKIDLP